jgi:hypothetical protein
MTETERFYWWYGLSFELDGFYKRNGWVDQKDERTLPAYLEGSEIF